MLVPLDQGTTTFRMERVDGALYLITVSTRIFVCHYVEAVEDFVRIGVRGRAEASLATTPGTTRNSPRCNAGSLPSPFAGRGHSAGWLRQPRLCAR